MLTYFVLFILLIIAAYMVYLNKVSIMALVIPETYRGKNVKYMVVNM